MTIFTWGNNPYLQKIQTMPLDKKAVEATLYIAPSLPKEGLASLSNMLRSMGMSVIPEVADNQLVLHVLGIKNENHIIGALEKNGFVSSAQRQKQKSPEEPKKRRNPFRVIQDISLVLSGYIYMVGDAALVWSGIKRKDTNELMTGLAFSASSVVLARYGKKSASQTFDELYDGMLREFVDSGVEFPEAEHISAQELGKRKGIVAHTEKFLYDHPAEVHAAFNAYAGYHSFRAGRNLAKTDRAAGFNKSMAGAVLGSSFLVGLLVPEKKKTAEAPTLDKISAALPDNAKAGDIWLKPDEEPKGFIGKLTSPLKRLYSKVEEQPLRVAGYGAIVNNLFLAASGLTERKNSKARLQELQEAKNTLGTAFNNENALKEAKRNQNNWAYTMTAAGSYIAANGLLSISSKDGNSSESAISKLYAATAAILVNQPHEVQESMINKMAFHFAEQKEISLQPDEIATCIRDKMDRLRNSQWMDSGLEKPKVRTDKAPDSDNRKTSKSWAEPDRRPTAWTSKEVAREKAVAQTPVSGAMR